MLTLIGLSQNALNAQVVIGANKNPETFSALEVESSTGGLRHPQLTTSQRDALVPSSLTSAEKAVAYGLVIYNIDIDCLEYYKNETEGWISLCSEATIEIETIPLDDDVIIRPFASSDGSPISGNYGKSRYDVAQSNSSLDGSCGVIRASTGRPGDFNVSTDLKRYYVVEFPPTEDMSKITDLLVGKRQYQVDLGEVSGNIAGILTNRINNIVVDFNTTVNATAAGRNDREAIYTTIYAIFKRNGIMKRVEYTFSVMDCLGCGIRIQTGDKKWMTVSCYNQGVTTSANPLVYSVDIAGKPYQWGRATDGHENTNSLVYEPIIALGEIVYPTAPQDSIDVNGQPTGERRGKFIPVTTSSANFFNGDWSVQHDPKLWGDGSQNFSSIKSVNDPCPAGFRIPTNEELTTIMHALTFNSASSGATAKDDGVLFLPYAGTKNIAGATVTPSNAKYWSSTVASGSTTHTVNALIFNGSAMSMSQIERAEGAVVRCIAE